MYGIQNKLEITSYIVKSAVWRETILIEINAVPSSSLGLNIQCWFEQRKCVSSLVLKIKQTNLLLLYHSNVVLLKSKFRPDIIPKIAVCNTHALLQLINVKRIT